MKENEFNKIHTLPSVVMKLAVVLHAQHDIWAMTHVQALSTSVTGLLFMYFICVAALFSNSDSLVHAHAHLQFFCFYSIFFT